MDEFPSFSYPFISNTNRSIQSVNYGLCPIVDINVSHNGQWMFLRQPNRESVTVASCGIPFLPFLPPNRHLSVFPFLNENDFYEYSSDRDNVISDILSNNTTGQLYNFVHDCPEEAFSCLRAILPASSLDERLSGLPDLLTREHEKLRSSKFGRRNYARDNKTDGIDTNKEAMQILNACLEVPRNILSDLISESLEVDYEDMKNGYSFGNCIAAIRSLILYPSGNLLDILNITKVVTDTPGNLEDICIPSIAEGEASCIKFHLNGSIQQLIASGTADDQAWVGVRCKYCCIFIKVDTTCLKNTTVHSTFASTVQLTSLDFSPYIQDEAVIADSDGNIFLLGKELQDSTQIYEGSDNALTWHTCFFGSSPRRFIVVKKDHVVLIDKRNSCSKVQDQLIIPNEMLVRVSELTQACCRHPVNTYQYFLTTTECLLLMDERFPHAPLLQVNHYLESPPTLIVCDPPEDNQFPVYMSNYKHREVVTLLLSHGETVKIPFRELFCPEDESGTAPCRVIMKPFKLSMIDDWLSTDNYEYPYHRRAVKERLLQPVIGLGVLTPQYQEGRKRIVFSMTRCGDLFWQGLRFVESTTGEASDSALLHQHKGGDLQRNSLPTDVQLKAYVRKVCSNWVEEALEDYYEAKKIPCNNSRFDYVQDCTELCVMLKDLADREVAMTINTKDTENAGRSKTENANEVETETGNETATSLCNVEEQESLHVEDNEIDDLSSLISTLSHLKRAGSILTSRSLGQIVNTRPLESVQMMKASKDPLSVVLAMNWDQDEYTPISVTGS